MKSFAGIVVSTALLFASAPAFAHGSGHFGMNGMNGMNGGNSHNMTTNTQTQTNNWNKINNTSTRINTTGHFSFGHKLFLRTEERILMHDIRRIEAEILRLKTYGSNTTRVTHLDRELARLEAKLLRVKIDIGQVS